MRHAGSFGLLALGSACIVVGFCRLAFADNGPCRGSGWIDSHGGGIAFCLPECPAGTGPCSVITLADGRKTCTCTQTVDECCDLAWDFSAVPPVFSVTGVCNPPNALCASGACHLTGAGTSASPHRGQCNP